MTAAAWSVEVKVSNMRAGISRVLHQDHSVEDGGRYDYRYRLLDPLALWPLQKR